MRTAVPIETVYKGYRFRSRLEARWAVFFDALDVRWEYEKEGYDLGPAGWYLPDFWLPDVRSWRGTPGMWAEVKPEPFSEQELAKAQALANQTLRDVLRLVGTPTWTAYYATCPVEMDEPWAIDYLLDDQYVHDEHRWFSSPGLVKEEELIVYASKRTQNAYAAARGARFEHGESPAW